MMVIIAMVFTSAHSWHQVVGADDCKGDDDHDRDRGNSGYDDEDEDEDEDDRIGTLIHMMLVDMMMKMMLVDMMTMMMLVDMMMKMIPHLRWTLASALYMLLKNQLSKTLSRLFPRQKRFHLEMIFVVFFLGGSLFKKKRLQS